jgi:hypothetical protein
MQRVLLDEITNCTYKQPLDKEEEHGGTHKTTMKEIVQEIYSSTPNPFFSLTYLPFCL